MTPKCLFAQSNSHVCGTTRHVQQADVLCIRVADRLIEDAVEKYVTPFPDPRIILVCEGPEQSSDERITRRMLTWCDWWTYKQLERATVVERDPPVVTVQATNCQMPVERANQRQVFRVVLSVGERKSAQHVCGVSQVEQSRRQPCLVQCVAHQPAVSSLEPIHQPRTCTENKIQPVTKCTNVHHYRLAAEYQVQVLSASIPNLLHELRNRGLQVRILPGVLLKSKPAKLLASGTPRPSTEELLHFPPPIRFCSVQNRVGRRFPRR